MTDNPLVGTLFGGRWLLERPLTSGGMGSVYVTKHTDTGRLVALKVIKSAVIHNPELTARFRRETAALASLSHPNIVTFLDSGIENGNVFLVMELLAGRTLRDALFEGPMPAARATRIAADICRALAAVHKSGLVHRDLKPENVFLQEAEGHDGIVKLIDFGIVRLEAPTATASTKTGAVIGTPGYISPEQLRGQPATPASDVYAVGVILYEMVTGRSPFEAGDINQMLVRQLIDPIVAPRTLAPNLEERVNDAILALMERDAAKRTQSAKDALALLTGERASSSSLAVLPPPSVPEQVEGAHPPSSAQPTRMTPLEASSPSAVIPRRSRVPTFAAAGLIALGMVGAAVVVVQPWRDTAPPVAAVMPVVPAASSAPGAPVPVPPAPVAAPAVPPVPVVAPAPVEPKAAKKKPKDAPAADERETPAKPREPARSPLEQVRVDLERAIKDGQRVLAPNGAREERANEKEERAREKQEEASENDEFVIVTMAGAIMRGAVAVPGVFTLTTDRINFAGPNPQSFLLENVLEIEPTRSLGEGSNRARLTMRGKRSISHVLLLEDRTEFIRKVNRALRAEDESRGPRDDGESRVIKPR